MNMEIEVDISQAENHCLKSEAIYSAGKSYQLYLSLS